MKFCKLLSFLIATFFLTISVQANVQTGRLDWNNIISANTAVVHYKKPYENARRSLSITVEHSNIGEQRIYITTFVDDDSTRCNVYAIPTTATMTFNGQAVKMTSYCKEYTDSHSNYYMYTPATERGHSFVVNLFKTSTTPITLAYDGVVLQVPVTGFTRVWNSAGGNAI